MNRSPIGAHSGCAAAYAVTGWRMPLPPSIPLVAEHVNALTPAYDGRRARASG